MSCNSSAWLYVNEPIVMLWSGLYTSPVIPPTVTEVLTTGQFPALCQKPWVAGQPPAGGGGTLQVTRLKPSNCWSTVAKGDSASVFGSTTSKSGVVGLATGLPLNSAWGEYSKVKMALGE